MTKRLTQEELEEVLRLHRKWLRNENGGRRANLDGANLDGAEVADVEFPGGTWAATAGNFTARNYQLRAFYAQDGSIVHLIAGCFSGTPQDFLNQVRVYYEGT